jgi:hypothetical protein
MPIFTLVFTVFFQAMEKYGACTFKSGALRQLVAFIIVKSHYAEPSAKE